MAQINDLLFDSNRGRGNQVETIFNILASSGLLEDINVEILSGVNIDVDSSAFEDLWELPAGGTKQYLSSAETMDLVSTSADDAVGGIGATAVRLTGLDNNYFEISEIVLLDGLTPVTTDQVFLRINDAVVVGSNDPDGTPNLGGITITPSVSTTKPQSYIAPEAGQARSGHYTVPMNKQMFVQIFNFSALRNDQARLAVEVRNNEAGTPFIRQAEFTTYQGPANIEIPGLLNIGSKSDFRIRARGAVNNNLVTGTMKFFLVDTSKTASSTIIGRSGL